MAAPRGASGIWCSALKWNKKHQLSFNAAHIILENNEAHNYHETWRLVHIFVSPDLLLQYFVAEWQSTGLLEEKKVTSYKLT